MLVGFRVCRVCSVLANYCGGSLLLECSGVAWFRAL